MAGETFAHAAAVPGFQSLDQQWGDEHGANDSYNQRAQPYGSEAGREDGACPRHDATSC